MGYRGDIKNNIFLHQDSNKIVYAAVNLIDNHLGP